MISNRVILFLYTNVCCNGKNQDPKHDNIATAPTALAEAILSNAFDGEFFPRDNIT